MTYTKMPAILAVFAIVASAGTLTSFNVFGTPSSTLDAQSNNGDGGFKMLGHLEIVAKNPNGEITAYRQTDNIVTNVGKTCVGVRLFGANTTVVTNGTVNACGGYRNTGKFSFVSIGTGTNSETITQTDLQTIFGARGNASSTYGSVGLMNSTGSAPVYSVIQRTFTANGTGTITESGLFDAISTGHMFARKTFTGITLNSLDSLTVTWRITYS